MTLLLLAGCAVFCCYCCIMRIKWILPVKCYWHCFLFYGDGLYKIGWWELICPLPPFFAVHFPPFPERLALSRKVSSWSVVWICVSNFTKVESQAVVPCKFTLLSTSKCIDCGDSIKIKIKPALLDFFGDRYSRHIPSLHECPTFFLRLALFCPSQTPP